MIFNWISNSQKLPVIFLVSTLRFYPRGVLKVANLACRLSWSLFVEAGVVDVADNSLNPGQDACWW